VMAYYQVPADIIEDAESLVAWARKSVAVALASHAAKAGRKPRAKAATKKKKTAARAKPRKRR